MQIITDYNNVPDDAKRSTMALGNFDGVHKGHLEVINKTVEIAKSNHVPAAVMTFEPHPLTVLHPDKPLFQLIDLSTKRKLMEQSGVDILFEIPFTRDFSNLTGADFITEVLVKGCGVSHIVVGYDFIFGHNRSGNFDLLQQFSKNSDYQCTQLHAVGEETLPYSSSLIRKLLEEGKLEEANNYLGWDFRVTGIVQEGNKQGRKLGFPTANILLPVHSKLAFGVYAVEVEMEETLYQGVANVGVKPTFHGKEPLVEAHIFDQDLSLYGKEVTVIFKHYIRQEQKFESIEALQKQIEQDCVQASTWLKEKV